MTLTLPLAFLSQKLTKPLLITQEVLKIVSIRWSLYGGDLPIPPLGTKINILQNGFENRSAVFRRLLAKHRTMSWLAADTSGSHTHSPSRPGTPPLTAAGAASPPDYAPLFLYKE